MKARILLASGVHPRYLASFFTGITVTSNIADAMTLPVSEASDLLQKIQDRWPLAQLSYELGA